MDSKQRGMKKYKYLFVVLVYKNIDVLRDFFLSLNLHDFKVIVVNSYYDEQSLNECKEVSIANHADFLPIENKGFGYGNNVGTKYAMDKYEFDYLILSNSDIHILDLEYLNSLSDYQGIIAPQTKMVSGKNQNPNAPCRISLNFYLFHIAYKYNLKVILRIAQAIGRLFRELFLIYSRYSKQKIYKVYSCHGSFIIFSQYAVKRLYPFFCDEMFLYNEELYLAEKARSYQIPICYIPKIRILHMEGASSSNDTEVGFNNNKRSYEIFYNHLINNKW